MSTAAPASSVASSSERLVSLDVYRGLTMLLLASCDTNGRWLDPIAKAQPHLTWLPWLADQFDHVAWSGMVLWDLIQPSFMFMVGVAMAYSCAARQRRGEPLARTALHAAWRSLALVLLGIFLRSIHSEATNWTLEDVVSQIGLGYFALFWLHRGGWRAQLGAVSFLLTAYGLLFALWPLPPANYDYTAVMGEQNFTGFFAHWNKNANPAHYFDCWLLNLPPRAHAWVANSGGYNTLNFVPSLATMLLGSLAGDVLQSGRTGRQKFLLLLGSGLTLWLAGYALQWFGICPIVKRIWTPAFALAAGGICLTVLALLFGLVDLRRSRWWTFPLVVVGMNPLAVYVLLHLFARPILQVFYTHLGSAPFEVAGPEYRLLIENLTVGAVLWLIAFWMYRRKLFVRL